MKNIKQKLGCAWLLQFLYVALSTAQTFPDKPYNRIQFHKDKWQALHTDAFHVYFPKGYDSLCSFFTKEFPVATALVKLRMGSSYTEVPNVIIYPSTDQLYESNMGSFEPQQFSLPTFVFNGSRIMLAYTGDHAQFREQIREALVRSVWETDFKNDLKEQVKSIASEKKIPSWFKEGMIRYFAHHWPIGLEDALRKSYEQNHFTNWDAVIAYQPRLAGQAFCYFLSQQYYQVAVMQLYMQLKKKRSLPRASRLIVKKPLDSLLQQCHLFYTERFKEREANVAFDKFRLTTTIPHKQGIIRSYQYSSKENYLAYVTATIQNRTVWVYNLQTNRSEKIVSYSLPPWIEDHSADMYPIISWTSDEQLLVTMPVKGKIVTQRFSPDGSSLQKNTFYGTDGINSIEETGKNEMLLSAYRKGQTDIVQYNSRTEKYTALTDDSYDDLSPVWNPPYTYFISGRLVKKENTDSAKIVHGIFTLQDKTVSPLFTDTIDYIRYNRPQLLPDGSMLFTHTRYGTERFAVSKNNSQELQTIEPYRPFQYNTASNNLSFFKADGDSIYISKQNINEWVAAQEQNLGNTSSPWLMEYRKNAALKAKEDSILKAARNTEPSFLDGVLTPKNSKERAQKKRDSLEQSRQYDAKKVRPYILQLYSSYFTARVNNDYFINRYQPYLNYQGQFKFPEAGGLIQGGYSDLFENHHFSIGYRMPAGTEGSDFFVHYENTKKKTDWGLTWFRKVESLQPDPDREWLDENGNPYPNTAKVKTNYYEVSLHHPLSYFLSVDFQTALRDDRTIFLSTEKYSLKYNDIKSDWSISTLSARLNKLKTTVPLLNKGFKGKITSDLFLGFSQRKDAVYAVGADLQYHLPLYKYITAVVRAQAGHSGGRSKILYNLAGMDNNLTVRVDSNVLFPQDAPYAFQTLVTPLRGYLQNRIIGNQYAICNADIYFPLFQTLIPIETALSSVNLLQPGLFIDVANAKEMWKTNAPSNWQWSYGISTRTELAGYPLRFDIAWPGSFEKKPVWYLSLSL